CSGQRPKRGNFPRRRRRGPPTLDAGLLSVVEHRIAKIRRLAIMSRFWMAVLVLFAVGCQNTNTQTTSTDADQTRQDSVASANEGAGSATSSAVQADDPEAAAAIKSISGVDLTTDSAGNIIKVSLTRNAN